MKGGERARALERAIRAHCLACSGGMRNEVRGCRIRECALWPYRCGEAEAAGPSAERGGMAGQMRICDIDAIREAMA